MNYVTITIQLKLVELYSNLQILHTKASSIGTFQIVSFLNSATPIKPYRYQTHCL